MNSNGLRIGLARLHAEPGERRDFLPNFVAHLVKLGAQITLEHEYGSGLGLTAEDYQSLAPAITFASHAAIYEQDYVLSLRCPGDEHLRRLRPGACLISMLHYPTRPQRVALLRALGVEAISLDSLEDDNGRRLVENLQAVAWNGVEAAFETLSILYPAPGFDSPQRPPIHATLLGAGAVGGYVTQAVVRYGSDELRQRLCAAGVPGVQLTAVDYDLTSRAAIMRDILAQTDLLIDATQRPDARVPVIPNAWLAVMPQHAVLLDLAVDPYSCEPDCRSVKGIEGIPQGDLDQYQFAPDDPAYARIPSCVATTQRRHVVSCYSWPGVHPYQCMQVYGVQLRPILRRLIENGGIQHIEPHGHFFERAINRARLSRWPATDTA
jgi:alanine dehydrogenase